jgi:DNA polymerase-3 subunit delta'
MEESIYDPFMRLFGQDDAYHLPERFFAQQNFPHALLIEGESGSGRRSLAAFVIAMLLCRKNNPPCQDCPSCRKMKHGAHPDWMTIAPENDKKSIGVDQIRRLRSLANLAPNEAPRRVCMIPNAELMTAEAQNALLKLMEEPPPSLVLICTVRAKESLLETLVSRMTPVRMQPLQPDDIVHVLRQRKPDTDESLLAEAAVAAPTVGQALALLDDENLRQRLGDAALILNLCKKRERYELLKLLSGREKDRAAYVALFEAARRACVAALKQAGTTNDALRVLRLADIMEQTAAAAAQNVSLPLLSAVTAGRLTLIQ